MRRIHRIIALSLLATLPSPGARLKELAAIEGVRDNQLIGYGIVVGLNGTGDKRQTVFSAQALANLLQRMGVSVSPTAILVRNMAAVMVTATLPPFAQPGTRIDITAAAIGDSASLQGGLLLLTPLKGPDGQVYAAAQGAVITGGFSSGRGGNSQTVNHPTVGRVPGGAIVEKAPPSVAPSAELTLQLREADFTTASRITSALNQKYGAKVPVARADSAAAIHVTLPREYVTHPVDFIAEMEAISIESDRREKVVINERTGTIVLGKGIRIAPTAIVHGSLHVEVRTNYEVSQPEGFSQGKTTVTPNQTVEVKEQKSKSIMLDEGASVEDMVRALQAIGSTPREVIAVLQSLKAVGALDAEIEAL